MTKLQAPSALPPRPRPHYCDAAPVSDIHREYHAREYGFPQTEERALCERLALEIMQAGLSWETILRKRAGFSAAFDQFDTDRVAAYGAKQIERLMQDTAIIRNRLKILAVIENARRIIALRKSAGGFAQWLAAHHPLTKAEWVKLFKKSFLFTGGEITGEFLMSIGYLPGAHRVGCAVGDKLAKLDPPWMTAEREGFAYN